MRKLASLALALVALLGGSEASGSTVTISNPDGGGAPYHLDFSAGAGIADQNSFCVEADEGFTGGATYTYTVDTYVAYQDAAHGGDANNRDYLSAATAYLFTQFAYGTFGTTLGTYDAGALQDAIWYLEQDLTSYNALSSLAQGYVSAAQDAVDDGIWAGLGNVRVLNLWGSNGADKQSQLIVVPPPTGVPEPGTLALAGLGLGAFAVRRRRS